ncbi:MAG: flavin reductase family protein [Desulfovibrio sp.]|uniref:flavin reductase family protein n=1 Tax=Desulfovibrio sp. TaxID=885 RepID=UPI0025C1917C|nr:flavin reductase family protein [Desulfovibrio sp.]MBS6830731.1 flavin reductase family protein [Desulfovibrio sp.]
MFASLGALPFALPAPAFLIGSYDRNGRPNIMTAAWSGICCSRPPCIGVGIARERWSHVAVQERRAFTISIPSAAMAAQADAAGMRSGRNTDKFDLLGLTPVKGGLVDAPYVAECPAVLELRLREQHELGTHTLFIGEVLDVKIREDCLDAEGRPDPALISPLLYAPVSKNYWSLGKELGKGFSLGKEAAGLGSALIKTPSAKS